MCYHLLPTGGARKNRVWQLLVDNHLPEIIASWTIDIAIAKAFKGGVSPPGLHGVIFKITPPKDSVVRNLLLLQFLESAPLAG